MRWRVERAGAPGHYIPGWIAMSSTGLGASFSTHAEAIEFAQRRATQEAQHAHRGLMKLRARRALQGVSA